MNLATNKSSYPHLENAPIVEAVLDIRVQLPAKTKDTNILHGFFEKVKSDFPIEQKHYLLSGQFEFRAAEETFTPNMSEPFLNGYLFFSEDKKRTVQARIDGFTYNLLKPYSEWKTFSEEAKRLWHLYAEIAEPSSVIRVALRYINKIELPSAFIPKDYFKTIPVLAESLSRHTMYNLFSQVSIKNDAIGAFANITEGIERILNTDNNNFLLDIDTFCDGTFDEETIWKKFEELHTFKNEIFFESLTDKTISILK